ncbi:MAG: glycosyltransferase family 87 protein [Casimicrobiaceae bacterium]
MSGPPGDARGSSGAGDARPDAARRDNGDKGGNGGKRGNGAAGAWMLLLGVGVAIALVVPGSEWFQISFAPAFYADSDYELHWAASQALVHHQDPYDPTVVASYGATTGRDFTPFCAANPLMVRLFALTGGADVAHFEDGYRSALAFNGALLLLSALLLAAALRYASAQRAAAAQDTTAAQRTSAKQASAAATAGSAAPGVHIAAALAAAAAMLAFNDGTWMALHYNQLNFVALAAVCGALVAAQRGRAGAEGALLALAAAAKTSPALLIVVAAMAGRWRTVRAAALTAVALGVLSVAWNGWAVHASWLAMAGHELGYAAEVRPGFFNNSHHEWNLSPNGALSRASEAAGWSPATVRVAAWGVTAVVLGALWVAVRRITGASRRHAAGGEMHAAPASSRGVFAQYALGVSATFLVSSVTWSPHLSLAALPAMWLAHAAWSGASRRAPGLLLIGALAYGLLCVPLGTFGTPLDLSRDIQFKLAACVLLFAVTWSLAIDDAKAHAPS